MRQTSIFGKDVAKSKDARRVRELCKIRLHHAWPSSILHLLELLRITDQWYIVPVKFRFRRNREFLALLSLPLAGGPKDGKHFDAHWRLISTASFHTSSDNFERNTQKSNLNNKDSVRKKQLRLGCNRRDLVKLSFVRHNALQRRRVSEFKWTSLWPTK